MQDECYNSAEFKARNGSVPNSTLPPQQAWPRVEILEICNARIRGEYLSRRLRIAPGPPEKIVAIFDLGDAIAGEPFVLQPKCTVLDNHNNLVEGEYEVFARVENGRGQGCLCNISEGEYCNNAMITPTVQTCAGACTPGQMGGRNRVTTKNGWANFTNLACTKASCSRNCTGFACGEENCDRFSPYRFSCLLVGGGCSPCTDTTKQFHVYPNKYSRIQPGDDCVCVAAAAAAAAAAAVVVVVVVVVFACVYVP